MTRVRVQGVVKRFGETAAIGVGVYVPFGYKSQWDNPDQFTGRFICLDCRVRSWAVNPTFAWKVEDRLAIGGGVVGRAIDAEMSFYVARKLGYNE